MGLDMYLEAEVFISGYPHAGEAAQQKFKDVAKAAGLLDISSEDTPHGKVVVTAVYWRKANQIHAWFVNNVQDGVDECKRHYVSREKLTELRDLCLDVLENGGAESKLPTQSGFFFGGTEYDEWYIKDLEHTAKSITNLLEKVPEDNSLGGVRFCYQSSW